MSDYPCAYCNRAMDHKRQPNLSYAECWDCLVKRLIKERDELRKSLSRWQVLGIVLPALLGAAVFVLIVLNVEAA